MFIDSIVALNTYVFIPEEALLFEAGQVWNILAFGTNISQTNGKQKDTKGGMKGRQKAGLGDGKVTSLS